MPCLEATEAVFLVWVGVVGRKRAREWSRGRFCVRIRTHGAVKGKGKGKGMGKGTTTKRRSTDTTTKNQEHL